MKAFTNLHEMLASHDFEAYQSDRMGNNLWFENPELAERGEEYAKDGADGMTHGEHIEIWRDFLGTLRIFDPAYDEIEYRARCDIEESVYQTIAGEIDACEAWHDKNGSLNRIIN